MKKVPSPLLAFLADHTRGAGFDEEAWSLLLAEARACGVMSRVASVLMADEAVFLSLPEKTSQKLPRQVVVQISQHMQAALMQSDSLAHAVQQELAFLGKALAGLGTRVLLLKGAAYCAAGLPAARGRIFSDIDLLVAKPFIAHAEAALMLGGWAVARQDAYDQRYYREWAHEIPPMTHLQRGTTVDLHHSLAMPTGRVQIDSAAMVAAAVAVPGEGNWYRLQDEDMVLHAASHLLLNSEFERGLRDLWDIDLLVRHFVAMTPDFIFQVLARADSVGLGKTVRIAFALCHHIFRTPLPAEAMARTGIVAWLLRCAATTRHPQTRPRTQGLADQVLFVREIALRLPVHLLARHLWHKATAGLSRKAQAPG